jgi:hypothetical protein
MGVITISREAGSLGDEIAGLVAQEMGYEVMDNEKVHQMAMSCDNAYKDACTLYEHEMGQHFWERFFFNSPANASLFESLNYEVAAKGNVVVLGRGAQVVLKDLPGVFKARIVAPLEVRVARVAQDQGITDSEARKFVSWYDKQRRSLMESVFEQDLGDVTLYDMVLNTRYYSAQSAAKVLVQAAREVADSGELDAQLKLLGQKALEKKIETHIRRELVFPYQRTFEVKLGEGGVLTLQGLVSDRESKHKADKIAKGYPEVKQVDNQMVVTNLSY